MKKWLSILWAASMLLCLCACGDDTIKETPAASYPPDMLDSFTALYDRNNEVRGWISYHADGNRDFLSIEYPIMYSGDNSKYLNTDFDGNKNRNGTLFFDQNNKVNSYKDENRSLIVYGHNMATGQMFAGLNKLLGNVNNARASATLTMSTLFRQDEYKVFAVVLIDASDEDERSYDMWQTEFASDGEFIKHIESIRARSLYDYPVDVDSNDQILVLSTVANISYVKNGRLLVVARRVRDGEDATVNPSAIVKNLDVIMPYYWYINQNVTPHPYYVDINVEGSYLPNSSTKDPTATQGSTDVTTELIES